MRVAVSVMRSLVLLLAAGATLVPVDVASAAARSSGIERTSEAAYADAMRFRAEFGFRADRQFVVAAARNVRSYSNVDWGVPLSSHEVRELERRRGLEQALLPAITFAESVPGFAGFYLDQANGGIPVFLFADSRAGMRRDLGARLPVGVAYRLESVVRTARELGETQAAVTRDIGAWLELGIRITSIAVDVPRNSVLVGIHDLTNAARTALVGRYGPSLDFVERARARSDACTSVSACWPPKGGIKIFATAYPSKYCTSGFVARRPATGNLMLVTAGHCIAITGGYDKQWKHGGNVVGQSRDYVWEDFANADVGLIRISSAAIADMAGNYDQFVSDDSPITVTDLGGVGSRDFQESYQQLGYQVCRLGATSGRDCGTIQYTGMLNESCVEGVDCKWIANTTQVSFDSSGGDSGGSVWGTWSGTPIAFGIHTHSEDDDLPSPRVGWYSTVDFSRSTLIAEDGVTIEWCVTNGC